MISNNEVNRMVREKVLAVNPGSDLSKAKILCATPGQHARKPNRCVWNVHVHGSTASRSGYDTLLLVRLSNRPKESGEHFEITDMFAVPVEVASTRKTISMQNENDWVNEYRVNP